MLGTLKLPKTLKSSRDDFNVKYKNGKLYLTLNSSRDDFNVLDNFNVSSIKTANGILFRREITYRLSEVFLFSGKILVVSNFSFNKGTTMALRFSFAVSFCTMTF